MLEISIDKGLRPCYVDGKKALFHIWNPIAKVLCESPLTGGTPGGQLMETYAIVELEDGQVKNVPPGMVKFVPGIFNEYCFETPRTK